MPMDDISVTVSEPRSGIIHRVSLDSSGLLVCIDSFDGERQMGAITIGRHTWEEIGPAVKQVMAQRMVSASAENAIYDAQDDNPD